MNEKEEENSLPLTSLTYLLYCVTNLFGCLLSIQITFLMNDDFDVALTILSTVNEVVKIILGFDKFSACMSSSESHSFFKTHQNNSNQ